MTHSQIDTNNEELENILNHITGECTDGEPCLFSKLKVSDKELAKIKKYLMKELPAYLASRDQQIALAERRKFRELWDALGMRFGASAGSATGVSVRNDFGEEFNFQLDRDAVNSLHKYLNDKSLKAAQEKS